MPNRNVKNRTYRQSPVRTLRREGFGNIRNYNSHLSKAHVVNLLTAMLKNT